MEVQVGKYVRLVCDIRVGDIVTTSRVERLEGKRLKVLKVQHAPHFTTQFALRIEQYGRWISPEWVKKV